jgi:hypothetical protein
MGAKKRRTRGKMEAEMNPALEALWNVIASIHVGKSPLTEMSHGWPVYPGHARQTAYTLRYAPEVMNLLAVSG